MKLSKLVLGSFFGLLLTGQSVLADTCSTGLMPLFTGPQAKEICATFSAGTIGVLANNTYAVGRNAANSANIDVWKVDATDDTVLNADTGDVIKLSVAGTSEVQIDNDSLTFTGAAASVVGGATSLTLGSAASTILKADADAQRIITFDASSDTALSLTFGDATASQRLDIIGTTADAADTQIACFSGGGSCGSNGRGSYFYANGADVGGADAGDALIGSTDDVLFYTGTAGTLALTIDQAQAATFAGKAILSANVLNVAANVEAVAGAGSTVSDAAALSATKSFHQITGANGTLGWKFPSATAGDVHFLLNTTAGVPKVYAVSGGTCNGGAADAACTLVTGIVLHACYATATNAWICS